MSETDKFADVAHEVWALSGIGPSEGVENAAERITSYLREHFVTREDYEARDGAVGGWMAQAIALRIERDRLQQDLEDVRRWNSENYNDAFQIAATAELSKLEELSTLTAERDRLRAALEGIEACGSGQVVGFEPGPDASPDYICGIADGFRMGAKFAAGLAAQVLNPEDV